MQSPLTRSAEWRAQWPLVLAATVGFSFNSITGYSVGLFMEPLQREFGWSRTQISAGLSMGALVAILLSAPVGALIDKWGTRRIAVPGLFLTGCSLASFAFANGSVVQWMALWLIYALIALSTKSTVWTCAVSGMFSAGRSLAIAVTLSGAAVAQIIAPPLTNWLIGAFGWRMAYMCLGLGWGGIAMLLTFLFLYDSHDQVRRIPLADRTPLPNTQGGLTLRQAFRNPPLLRIGVATLITMVLSMAALVHQVPILIEAGMPRGQAAYVASLVGVAAIIGKLATGWLMERGNANWVGSLTLAASAVAFLMLLDSGRSPALVVGAMLIIGYTGGTKIHICAYMTSRYAGLRNFGAIFGVMSSLIAAGSGIGPVLGGYIYDSTGSYTLLMLIGIPASLISGLLIFRLGAYPEWSRVAEPIVDPLASALPATQ